MQTFFIRFYMQLIEKREKIECIPVSYLFQMIKSLGILNEKQKAYGKRGETQADQRGPRAAALFAESGLRAIHGFCGEKTCACLGRSQAAHFYNKQAHVLQPIAHFWAFFEGKNRAVFVAANRSVFAPLKRSISAFGGEKQVCFPL